MDVALRRQTLADLLHRSAKRFPNKTAIVCGETVWSYAAFDTLSRIAVDPESDERYPGGTVLIPADSPEASVLISRAINESRPITLVFPDGSDVVARPPDAKGLVLLVILGLVWLLDRANKKFERRFQAIERLAAERGIRVADAGLSVLDALWDEVKAEE